MDLFMSSPVEKFSFPVIVVVATLFLAQLLNPSFWGMSGRVFLVFLVAFFVFVVSRSSITRTSCVNISQVHLWLAGGLVLVFLSSTFAFNKSWALLMTAVLLLYVLLFFLIVHISGMRHDFPLLIIDLLLFFGLVGALLGFYEYVYYHSCGPTHAPLIPYLLPPDGEGRISGPYGQPNLFALFLTLTLLAYFYRYLHASLAPRCRSVILESLRFLPFLAVACVFFLTRSKGGLLSLFLLICFLLWLVASKRYLADDCDSRKEFFRLLGCLCVAFVLSRLTFTTGVEEFVATRSLSNTGINPDGRFVFWTSAILIFLDHPWLGVGLDNYRFLMNGYGPASHDLLGFVNFEAMKSTFWAHNEYLQLLAEGGIFLFGLVLFFLFFFFKKIWTYCIRPAHIDRPLFLYSHLFLVPFLIQSQFSWPLRHPALLLLFVT
ncbi:MAG: O-antigen ligase family protein, partial [Desulfuromonadaceae bacterium]|nr:O-antigen ligase family protein [Desulfuromonadaceae bacterium]